VPGPDRLTSAVSPERLRIRRFSEGVERAVLDHFQVPRIGSFGTGRRRPGFATMIPSHCTSVVSTTSPDEPVA
jgi:hypothetical protein